MVELVIVIAIIAILLAFLLPAISGAITSARNATVTSEIKNLEKAIAEFKLKFGVEPPSSIVLYERSGDGMNGTPHWNSDGSSDQYDVDGDGDRDNDDRSLRRRQSVAFLRQVWPEFNFETANFDINGDGDFEDTLVLNGAECLLFFLGGVCATEDSRRSDDSTPIRDANGGTSGTVPRTPQKWVPLGFSTNPVTPFARGGSRVGPFFEFDPSRIFEVNEDDGDSSRTMPEYVDTLPGQRAPYIFVSSNGGRGYSANDLSLSTSSSPRVVSPISPYTSDAAGLIPYNQNSYQIISPGLDQQFGTGGVYNPETGFTGFDDDVQKDNITNFSGGVLDPS